MKESKIIFEYSLRLLIREWRRFVLPLLSLTITGIVLVLVLLLTAAGDLLLSEQARDLLGGDVVVESTAPVDIEKIWQETALSVERQTMKISFSASTQSDLATMTASFLVVDNNYPLYGEIILADGVYQMASDKELYLDKDAAERLEVNIGDTVFFGEADFVVAGIIAAEPNSLFGGFRFLPRVIMSDAGFIRSGIDSQLLRAEYEYAAVLKAAPTSDQKELISTQLTKNGLDVEFAGSSRTGLQRGLAQVSEFLIITVLITSVLAAVNVYASTVYLMSLLRRSFAVLLALGMKRRTLVSVLGLTLTYVVLLAGFIGAFLGYFLFIKLSAYISTAYFINLPTPGFLFYAAISLALIIATTVSSFFPAVRNIFAVSPRRILITGEVEEGTKLPLKTVIINTGSTLIPLAILATFLLGDFVNGFLVMLGILIVYILIALTFFFFLALLYKIRHRFSFFVRSIISQKKADGLFGIVSFTSLFVALTALSSLVLIQVSLERYLVEDLSRTIPTTYVLDVQPSQKEELLKEFPDLTLFANIQSRIIDIDGLRIQELLTSDTGGLDRELGREFNLTFRKDLLSSERITKGDLEVGKIGEISVDEEFAKRADIEIGSSITFLIQGLEVNGKVTSFRSTDSRSGLPFFYFVMSPEDIGQFPNVNFGYAYYDVEKQKEISRYLATNMPNVSVIETQTLGPILVQIISTLLTLIVVIAIPPLLIATLLIATLVISSYGSRRREGARLRALGATKKQVLIQYLAETMSLTFVSTLIAYILSVGISYAVSTFYIGVDTTVIFDRELLFGLALVVLLIAILGLYLFKSDNITLRQLLAYEENN